jgi:methionine-rich copper-binding protein CopC
MLRKSVALVALVLVALPPATAFAAFERPFPMIDNAPSPLPDLVLTFSDGVNLPKSSFTLIDSQSRPVPISGLQLSASGTDVTVPLKSDLKPGVYTMKWDALSKDGRKDQGEYSFEIAP